MYLTNDRRLLCIPRRSRTGHGQRVRCGAANPRTVNTGRGDRRSYAWGLAIRAVVLPMPQSSPPGGATRRSRCNGSPPRPRTARNDPGAPSRAGAEPDARTHSRSSREAGATQCATGSDEFRPSDGSDRHELWIGGGERATRTSGAVKGDLCPSAWRRWRFGGTGTWSLPSCAPRGHDVLTSDLSTDDDSGLFPLKFMRRLALERLNIVADVIDTGHLPAFSRPHELVRRLETYRLHHAAPAA